MAEFSVVSWNCRRATADSPLWDYHLELNPDVALLQEVGGLSPTIRERYACDLVSAAWKHGEPLKVSTGLLVRGEIIGTVPLVAPFGWVDEVLARFGSNLVGREVRLAEDRVIRVISAYSPAWPVDHGLPEGQDTSEVRLPANPDLWLADILWACLRQQPPKPEASWIVGGDLNLSETFDANGEWHCNRVWLERMGALGFVECLRSSQGRLTPTFRHSSGSVKHQMDHLFVTQALAEQLTYCTIGSHERVFDSWLSDHLPVVAHFRRDPLELKEE
jgi:exonuclease III